MDSVLNIKLKKGLIILKITKVVGEAGEFKVVADQDGAWHRLNRSDFDPEKWKQIKAGKELGVSTQRVIRGIFLLSGKPIKTTQEKVPLDADCIWICKTCGAKAPIESSRLTLENLPDIAEKACKEHKELASTCGHFVISIVLLVFTDMVENENLTRLVTYEISKIS